MFMASFGTPTLPDLRVARTKANGDRMQSGHAGVDSHEDAFRCLHHSHMRLVGEGPQDWRPASLISLSFPPQK